MLIESEYNWGDNLNKCTYFPSIEIGSYQCSQCKYFNGIEYQDHICVASGFTVPLFRINCEKNYHD